MRRMCIALLSALLLTGCTGKPAVVPTETTAPATEPTETTQVSAEPEITAPEELSSLLEVSGTELQTLTDLGCKQLITVTAEGVSAQIDLYLLENDSWCRQDALSCSGFVGLGGTIKEKREGDKATPRGIFPVTQAFYINDAPETGLTGFQITEDTYWVDDPASRYYNKRIEGTENKDWTSAEHMIRYGKAYEYGFVVGYNPDAVPYAGSAIFFHVGSSPTAGCVATEKAFVLKYLAALDEREKPYILIN